jgi:LacI family transcriptional regulator
MSKKRVTISSIAHEIGVSNTLVSMVLNGKGNANSINKETQKRVLDKAREMNYQPNQVARGLRTGTTKTIGLIVADISNPIYSRVARIAEDYANLEGYSLFVCSSDEDENREKKLLQMLVDRQVDGIILASTLQDPDTIQKLINQNFPIVLFDRYFDDLECNYVGVDNETATQEAIHHLIKKGHQNIGFLTLSPKHISSLRDRKKGFQNAMENAGLEIYPNHIVELGFDDLKDKNYEKIKDFVMNNPDMTAIFTTNNNLAVGCMDAIHQLGKRIPEDISLITFDDVELFQYTNPPLSSIAQPIEKIGEIAISSLLQQIKSQEIKNLKKELPAKLIIRKS